MAAKETGIHYRNVPEKLEAVFGSMTPNQRPYTVALGGEGEPTAHPEFEAILAKFSELGITPNYTTNGMHLSDELIEVTKRYGAGVAVSIHPHLKQYWTRAIEVYAEAGVRLNTHVVVSSKNTIKFFWKMFDRYRDRVEYSILLPYMSNREAPYEEVDLAYLERTLDERQGDLAQVAFGSNLHQFLVDTGNRYNTSLYEPESVSGYLILDDPIRFREDSHGMREVPNHAIHKHISEYRAYRELPLYA